MEPALKTPNLRLPSLMIGNGSADLVYDPRATLRDNGTAPGPPVNSYGAMQNHSINHKHQTSPQPETKDERHSANHSRVCGWVCIEIPVFLFFLSLNNSLPVTQYYLTAREYRDLGVPNVTGCSEGGEGEGGGASLLDTIQARVSTYTMYLNFLGSLPAILPVLFMGSISHRYGRKVALYLVSLGAMARMAVFTLVFHYEWRVEYLYIGSVLEGMTGGFGCFLMSSYTIVADATKEGGSRRAVKITLTEAATMLGSSAGLTMSGYWVRSLGYVAPLLFSAGLQVFVIIFLFLFVPETVPSSPPTPISCSILLKSLKVFLKKTPTGRRGLLLTSIATFFMGILNLFGSNSIIVLYLLHYPFCWTETHISVYTGVFIVSSWLMVLLTTHATSGRLADDSLALIGALSGLVGFLLQGLANKDLFIYLGAGAALLSNMMWPMLRVIMSKAVDIHEQACLFAGIGVTEMLSTLVTGVLSPYVYKISLGRIHGLPFLGFSAISFLGACCIVSLIARRKTREGKAQSVNGTYQSSVTH